MTAFDGYIEDYDQARVEALKAIDEYARCSDPGTKCYYVWGGIGG